jgi:hypothetical protein
MPIIDHLNRAVDVSAPSLNGISIPGNEADSARSFDLFAQSVSVVP